MLDVSEIFGPTIQGEGKRLGHPSIFIRFSRCNMSCEGFDVRYTTLNGDLKKSCDTFYAVDPCFKEQWKKQNFKDIIKEVSKLLPDYKIDIVITGGEPLLYWNNEEFQKLLKYYIIHKHNVTIETNASLDIDFREEYQKKILFSMSVKLSNSLEKYKKRVNISTIKKILSNTTASYFKFVIDYNSINKLENEIKDILLNIKDPEVYLMPMAKDNQELEQNSKKIIDIAIKNGFYYSDRLHIRVWDNKRGV